MSMIHSRARVALGVLSLSTWSLVGHAQQAPGSNAPAPVPAPSGEPAVMAAPSSAVIEEPIIDPSTESTTRPNKPLLITGMVLLGGTYGASVIVAGFSDRESDDKLYYPVVGPWMAWKDRDCNADPCDNKVLGTTLLIGSGVAQGLGALGMVLSLVIPQKTTNHWYLIGDAEQEHVVVTPLMGAGELGAFAVGRF